MTRANLGDFIQITSGFAFPSEYFSAAEGMPLIRIRDVVRGRTETRYTGPYDKSFIVDNGDLLVGMDGEFNASVWRGGPALLNQRVCKIVPDSNHLDFAYLCHVLRRELKDIEARTPFVTVKHLSVKQIRAIELDLPSLREQQRIAAILDKANSVRCKRQEAIRLADEFLRSVYLDLAKRNFDRASVESVLATIPNAARTGPFGSQLLVSEFTETGIPVLGIDNVVTNAFTWSARRFISPEKYAELERYTVRPGDVMVTIMGTTGRVAVAPDDLPLCISTKHLCTLSLDQKEMRPSYLWACLRWDPEVRAQTQRESKGAIMEGWNMGIVKGLMISKPPMDAQLKFEMLLARISKFSQSASISLNETEALIAALSSKYFPVRISA